MRELTRGIERRIDELIEEAGGVRTLAEKTGLPQSSLSRYRANRARITKPNAEAVARIAEAAGVRLEWLLLGQPPKKPSTWSRLRKLSQDLLDDDDDED